MFLFHQICICRKISHWMFKEHPSVYFSYFLDQIAIIMPRCIRILDFLFDSYCAHLAPLIVICLYACLHINKRTFSILSYGGLEWYLSILRSQWSLKEGEDYFQVKLFGSSNSLYGRTSQLQERNKDIH